MANILFDSLQRLSNFPLDPSGLFQSKSDLDNYLNDKNSLAYPGQVLIIFDDEDSSNNGISIASNKKNENGIIDTIEIPNIEITNQITAELTTTKQDFDTATKILDDSIKLLDTNQQLTQEKIDTVSSNVKQINQFLGLEESGNGSSPEMNGFITKILFELNKEDSELYEKVLEISGKSNLIEKINENTRLINSILEALKIDDDDITELGRSITALKEELNDAEDNIKFLLDAQSSTTTKLENLLKEGGLIKTIEASISHLSQEDSNLLLKIEENTSDISVLRQSSDNNNSNILDLQGKIKNKIEAGYVDEKITTLRNEINSLVDFTGVTKKVSFKISEATKNEILLVPAGTVITNLKLEVTTPSTEDIDFFLVLSTDGINENIIDSEEVILNDKNQFNFSRIIKIVKDSEISVSCSVYSNFVGILYIDFYNV